MIFSDKSWFNFSLFYLFITAAAGFLIRYLFVADIEFVNYKNILNTHSHVALLGWIHLSLIIALSNSFSVNNEKNSRRYKLIYQLINITIVGMMFFFPIQGYSGATIAFLSLFLLISYWFCVQLIKDVNQGNLPSLQKKIIRSAVFYFILSSIGPWALGPAVAMGKGGSALYFNIIYFYLHFLYNGWIFFAIMALFFNYLDRKKIEYSIKDATRFYRLLNFICIPAFALSLLWNDQSPIVVFIGGLTALVQVYGLYFFLKIATPLVKQYFKGKLNTITLLLIVSLCCFCLKLIFQLVSVFPSFITFSYNLRDLIIGYLHLVFIGFFTTFLLAYFISLKFLKSLKIPVYFFIGGFIVNEGLLFGNQLSSVFLKISMPYYQQSLLIATVLMFVGVSWIFLRNLFPHTSS